MKYQARHTGPSAIIKIATRGGIIAGAAAIAALSATALTTGTANAAATPSPTQTTSPIVPPPTPTAAATPAAADTYIAVGGTNGKIKNVHSGKYLNVMADTYAPGSKLAQWDISGASHETFQFVTIRDTAGDYFGGYLQAESPDGKWYYVTATGENQLTLGAEVAHPSSAVLANVLASNARVLWEFQAFTFVNDNAGQPYAAVADDADWSTANGAPVIAYPSTGGKNQEWTMP